MTLVDKPGTDTSGKQPYQSGLLSRITAIHFPRRVVIAEQGLLDTNSAAVALDTGESFSGMRTGATGKLRNTKPFTVLSSGIVVFGQPKAGREEDACFMACVDGTTILRGHQDVGGDMEGIVWEPVYTVDGLCALSFAGGGFFVVYQPSDSGRLDSSCAVSFNGTDFSEIGNLYGGLPSLSDHDQLTPGSVAYNGNSYATAGDYAADPSYPQIISADDQMAWASSGDGSSWSADCSRSETVDPGIRPGYISFSSGTGAAYTTIAGGAGRFVAAATSRSQFQSTTPVPGGTGNIIYTRPTAAAAVSDDGSSWDTIKLPGATEASYVETGSGTFSVAESAALSVVFVRTGGSGGYFVISANGFMQSGPNQSSASWCWKGDGNSWSVVKQSDDPSFGPVSAVAKDLSATKIVTV
jgi:hypothetical protein